MQDKENVSKENIPEKLSQRLQWLKSSKFYRSKEAVAFYIISHDRPGLLMEYTSKIFDNGGNITFLHSYKEFDETAHTEIEIENIKDSGKLEKELKNIKGVIGVEKVPLFSEVYGKRVIVLGGGAQVAQVALGAITEADRHNIRGEQVSVDTSPVVGEQKIAEAVSAVARLHRASILVLAGSIMGGEIAKAVKELREKAGIPVITLNMAGSVTKEADLVVTDPVQAGVISVMIVSSTAKFDLEQTYKKRF